MSNVVIQLPFQEACYRLNGEELFVGHEEAILFASLGEEATLPIKLRSLSPGLTKLSADRIWERGEDEETQLSLLRLAERFRAPYQPNKIKSRLLKKREHSPLPTLFTSMRGVLKEGIESFLKKKRGVLEIGCGNGSFLTSLLKKGENAVGLEISNRCLKKSAFRLKEAGFTLTNRFLVKADGVAFLKWLIPQDHLRSVYLLFPDPWDGNIQRRIVTPYFLESVRERLVIGGTLFMATDHPGYANQMRQSIEKTPGVELVEWNEPLNTKYHEKWKREGRNFYRFAIKTTQHFGSPEDTETALQLEWETDFDIWPFATPTVVSISDGHFVVEKTYRRGEETLLRTVLNPSIGMAFKQFLLVKGRRLHLKPTWHEVVTPPLVTAVEQLKSGQTTPLAGDTPAQLQTKGKEGQREPY